MVNDRQRKVYEALPPRGAVEQSVWAHRYRRTLVDARGYNIYLFGQDRDYLIERGYVLQKISHESVRGFVNRVNLFSRSTKKLPAKK